MRIFNRAFLLVFLLLLVFPVSQAQDNNLPSLNFTNLDNLPDQLGVAGPFTGLLGSDQDILFVAGGANFPIPVWENSKEYHSKIYLGKLSSTHSIEWLNSINSLPDKIGYGASVTVDQGVLCMGGHNSEGL